MASPGLPLPPFFADCFTEKGWALMSEKEKREMIEIMNAEDVVTDETRRINRERERTLREASRRLLKRERERKRERLLRKSEDAQREALLTKQFACALKCQDDDACSAADNEDNSKRQFPIPEQDLSRIHLRAGLPRHERQINVYPAVEGSTLLM